MSKPSGASEVVIERRAAVVVAIVALALFALPATADALPPTELTGLDCVHDNDTGSGGCAVATDGLDVARAAAVSPDGRDVYVVAANDDSLVHLRRDPTDGSLTPVGCIDDNDAPAGPDTCAASTNGLDSVQDVVVSPDGHNVLTISANDDALANFTRNPATGALTAAGCIDDNDAPDGPDACAASTNGLDLPGALAISPDGGDVYVAGRSDDAVVQIRRDTTTGVLTAGGCIEDNDPPAGPDACAASTNGLELAQDVTVSPDGISVYVTSGGDDAIVTFSRNTATGVLNAAGATCIDDNDAGEGPDACGGSTDAVNEAENPVVSPDGRNVYLVANGPGDQAVTRFDRSAAGVLTPAGCIANAGGEPACAQTVVVFTGVQGLEVSPDGDALYAVSAGSRAVVSLRRSPDGAIVPAGCVQDVGLSSCSHTFAGLDLVRNVAVSPDGRDVYALGDGDDAVTHLIGERPPVCVGDTSGGLPDVLQTVGLGCSDPNGDPMTIEITQAPGSGTLGVVDQVARAVPYTPNAGFSGIDGFSFRATADAARSNTATATLLVQAEAGPAGPLGPTGPAGPSGPQGPAGEPATKLVALLGLDVVKARAGRRVKVRLGVTDPGEATLDVLKGSKVVASVKKSLSEAGRDTISWNGQATARAAGKPKPLKPGKYTLRLTVLGNDGQRATDSAKLKLTK